MGRISVDTTGAKEAFFRFGTEPANYAPALEVVMLICCFKKPANNHTPNFCHPLQQKSSRDGRCVQMQLRGILHLD
jgi:hypothetical protein